MGVEAGERTVISAKTEDLIRRVFEDRDYSDFGGCRLNVLTIMRETLCSQQVLMMDSLDVFDAMVEWIQDRRESEEKR